MKLKIILIFYIINHLFFYELFSQTDQLDSIFFSGVVMDYDSLNPLPDAHFIINSSYGGITDENGKFFFWANIGDTIKYSYVGYKDLRFNIADTLAGIDYLVGIFMTPDTLSIQEVLIYPRLYISDIKESFGNLNINDKNVLNATNNIRLSVFQAKTSNYIPWDPEMIEKQIMSQYRQKAMNKGLISPDEMIPVTALLPMAIAYIYQKQKAKSKRDYKITRQEENLLKNIILSSRRDTIKK